MSFRDMSEEDLVKARKDTLRVMLDQRPIIHKNVVAVSSINEQVCLEYYRFPLNTKTVLSASFMVFPSLSFACCQKQ